MSKITGLTDKLRELLSEKESLIEELQDVEKKLSKYSVDPSTFIGRCFMFDNYDSIEYKKIIDIVKGGFNIISVKIPNKDLKAGDDRSFPAIEWQRHMIGSFFDYDTQEITAQEFEEKYHKIMDLFR